MELWFKVGLKTEPYHRGGAQAVDYFLIPTNIFPLFTWVFSLLVQEESAIHKII